MNATPSSTPDSPAYDPPWLALPREVSDVLRPMMPGIVEAIIDAVPQLVPAYARPIEGRFGRGLRRGVAAALDRFLQLPATRLPALSEESRQLVAGLGSGEFRQGRSMDALLSAYRMGARVTFREMSRVSVEHHLGQSVVVDLGESILAYIDELSAVSAEAYAFEQSERAGAVDRRRTELLDLLLRGQADEAALRQKAAMADWSLPQRMAVVTLPVDRSAGLRLRLGPGTLVIERETDVVALVPARKTKSARADLDKALRGRGAAVGPAGGWEKVPDSLRLAVLAASVLPPREGPDDPPVWADEHLAEVVLGSEPSAITELANRRLAPLEGLRPAQRERLAETLLSWLRHWGQRAPVAAELGIHPQTVGYRATQLRELFGDALEDPRARFELELALHAGKR
ncbi:PucR family transcriptional regulator [Arthrobacter sp. EPSL27]|uniref:PucR family transcriptional regulator n=1 Tax=Arthrobacter sp. EPSL27 TaxID=1745378 RepID=UPI0007468EAD|nr:helix-turn-helix domain-containing protein [Arthrobacter sp. EPSL27]KUM38247.1 CdaR family transcriptional regulator [Arthrobacter sp. EPSL27]